ncbi:MAG TPA: hypothetical protein VFS21_10325 [Roseiflexaceae bacterium]|nr:hypothetical protein [Roseiflexaceae bacterium]
MSQLKNLAGTRSLACLLAIILCIAAVPPAAASPAAPSGAGTFAQQDGIARSDGDSIVLAADAPPAPAPYGSFPRFGIALSAPQQLPFFQTLSIAYQASAPASSAVRVDLRASPDGRRWSQWEPELASGASVHFDEPMRFAQYRLTLLGGVESPVVRDVRLVPQAGSVELRAFSDRPVAPTYRIRATRMGMVGGRTANGHRITKRDHFVSLPSWRSLSSKGGSEYMVRITYNGRSSVAPVYDVGPWNTRDNYWDEERERYKDLRRGWPQDHAAFYDGHNKGWAEKGKVRFPTGIDVGDGVWWDDLGIVGDQATVEVTFLWLGTDPLEQQAAPAAEEQAAPAEEQASVATAAADPNVTIVDNAASGFRDQAKAKWYRIKGGCAHAGGAQWTYTTDDPAAGEHSALWQPDLPAEARYNVYAHVPACKIGKDYTASARYLVRHRDGEQEVVVDQATGAGQWVLLGSFSFAAGEEGSVTLSDVAGDAKRAVLFDAVKWERLPDELAPEPEPAAEPSEG